MKQAYIFLITCNVKVEIDLVWTTYFIVVVSLAPFWFSLTFSAVLWGAFVQRGSMRLFAMTDI